jgi:hypothetical protein
LTSVLAATLLPRRVLSVDPERLPAIYQDFVEEMRVQALGQGTRSPYFYWTARSDIPEQALLPGFLGWALEC